MNNSYLAPTYYQLYQSDNYKRLRKVKMDRNKTDT